MATTGKQGRVSAVRYAGNNTIIVSYRNKTPQPRRPSRYIVYRIARFGDGKYAVPPYALPAVGNMRAGRTWPAWTKYGYVFPSTSAVVADMATRAYLDDKFDSHYVPWMYDGCYLLVYEATLINIVRMPVEAPRTLEDAMAFVGKSVGVRLRRSAAITFLTRRYATMLKQRSDRLAMWLRIYGGEDEHPSQKARNELIKSYYHERRMAS